MRPAPELAELRAHEPIARVTLPTGDEAWVVTRYEDIRQILLDQRFTRYLGPEAARLTMDNSFSDLFSNRERTTIQEGPGHTHWRRITNQTFGPRQMSRLRPRVEAIVERLLDALAEQERPADLVAALGFPLPIGVICELLGVPAEQQPSFRKWTDAMFTVTGFGRQEAMEAHGQLTAYAQRLIAESRSGGADNFLTQLLTVRDDDDGSQLSEAEVQATVMAILVGGYESTAYQIGKTAILLLQEPDRLPALRADPGALESAIEETLRWAGAPNAVAMPRYARADVVVGGTLVPKGATLLLQLDSANLDESQFADAGRLDVNRQPNRHLTFGHGPHLCLGAPLARLELLVALSALLRRFPTMRLAVPVEELRWVTGLAVDGPETLPVTW
jgi:cytochrome P450